MGRLAPPGAEQRNDDCSHGGGGPKYFSSIGSERFLLCHPAVPILKVFPSTPKRCYAMLRCYSNHSLFDDSNAVVFLKVSF